MKITYTEVHDNLRQLSTSITPESYVYDFLNCFGTAKASITRLKKKFTDSDEVISNGQIHFKKASRNLEQELGVLSQQKSLKKNKIRFVFVTDFKTVFARDVKADDTIQIKIEELHDEFEFFLPLAGMERASLATESVADARAAEKMAKLFDLLKRENAVESEDQIHAMNVFLSRVLFCFFAEDTGIFAKDQFTKTLGSLSHEDGSNVHTVMEELFCVLDTTNRENCSNNFKSFPYVNGGLFAETISIPHFNTRSRRALIECGSLDWSAINPDIFGSMIQAVMDVKKRSEMGMHYTSVQNIMKVLSPLFLDKLTEEYLKILDSDVKDETKVKNLKALCARLSKIKVGDMACGSGNFLIIAYKELRNLEINILRSIKKLQYSDEQSAMYAANQGLLLSDAPQCGISLGQFYGIEYDDFACSIAILSLWLVEHQMNQQFNEELGASEATLPLKSFNNIIHDNALRIDWSSVMPNEGETYIVGNPPFVGARKKNEEHTKDLEAVCKGIRKFKNLDYVSGWFIKGQQFISNNSKAKCALVATNSICQGDSVGILWSHLLSHSSVEIDFAYTSFNWSNNAKGKAAVTCVIVGMRNKSNEDKFIYTSGLKHKVPNINAYLISAPNVFVQAERLPLHKYPKMTFGSMPNDDGNLILTVEQKEQLITEYPEAKLFVRSLLGSKELINSLERYCLWINDDQLDSANAIPPIKNRISAVREYRENSPRAATKKLASTPYKFGEIRHIDKPSILFPSISSENRDYIPCDFFDANVISNNKNFVVYDGDEVLFALLSSKYNMLWAKAVAGRTRNDICYSNTICYNTLPLPNLNDEEKVQLSNLARRILKSRIINGGSLASMYGSSKMPDGLRNIHKELDSFVDSLYQTATNRSNPISTDTERLEVLFKMYTEMKEQQ
ncbi:MULTISPECIES: class I SAM-dependent DNA methyltransferase [Providencia]|uniref:class I SAM-dependent DNA methyltransferase n=1 Tax=Providencia TaxID=586 RepID=UPI002203FCC4|nr:class I SAM-dependent DNA methyltransferase [Providencia stuartii]